jgi:hypothetical protein
MWMKRRAGNQNSRRCGGLPEIRDDAVDHLKLRGGWRADLRPIMAVLRAKMRSAPEKNATVIRVHEREVHRQCGEDTEKLLRARLPVGMDGLGGGASCPV